MDNAYSFTFVVLTIFLVSNPIGNAPMIAAMIKDFDFRRQKIIMLRETIAALILAIFFQYFGQPFLTYLNVSNYSVSLCGGILLLYTSLMMIFPPKKNSDLNVLNKHEPFIVPIATPLISGPGLLTIIMFLSHSERNQLELTLAIVTSWIGVAFILMLAPYLQRILGKRGLIALEKLMGMIVTMIAMQMIINGIHQFMNIL